MIFNYSTFIILVFVLLFESSITAQETVDIQPDTWVGTDALGRTMPNFEEAGPVKKDHRRAVGIFYIAWHRDDRAKGKPPYRGDLSKVLDRTPAARLDGNHPAWTTNSYHWAEPELGYFLTRDEYVIRQDMSMLADAGVDVLIMDVTNAVRYWEEWETIFSVMQQMKKEGNRVPQFCFWAFNGPVITVVQDIYQKIYKPGRFQDLWFQWDGKPLLLYNGTPSIDANGQDRKHPNPNFDPKAKTDSSHPHFADPAFTEPFYTDYTDEVKQFFTLRTMWWGYYHWAGKRFVGTEDNWSFGYDMGDKRVRDMKPGELLATHQGVREQAAVTPAQHAVGKIGKSWSRKHGQPKLNQFDLPEPAFIPWLGKTVENAEGYGIYFQERWDEAIASDPHFLYINDWNEWTAGKYAAPDGQTYQYMGRQSNFRFVDQYNAEFNRGIQPMKGGYTDNYYMQMAQNIRRYKGVRPVPVLSGYHSITIDGQFEDWQAIDVIYRDTIGDVVHRDYPGYHGLHYSNNSGRNDIVSSKVANDKADIYFLATVRSRLTKPTDPNWMLLLIDADQDQSTGWFGYDLLVNKKVIDNDTTTLMKYDSNSLNKPWIELAKIKYAVNDNQLELAIPRHFFGFKEDNELSFDFHWADNPLELKDPISLCTSGDSAPNRRFNYRCIWKR